MQTGLHVKAQIQMKAEHNQCSRDCLRGRPDCGDGRREVRKPIKLYWENWQQQPTLAVLLTAAYDELKPVFANYNPKQLFSRVL